MGEKHQAKWATTPNTTAKKEKATGWARSTFTNADLNKLKKAGMLSDAKNIKMPGNEIVPHPEAEFRVIFSGFSYRGLYLLDHEFLRGLLFIYGVQLHHLTPNSILHLACFITLYECFLGVHPHWGLRWQIFFIRRNASKESLHDVGDVIFGVRPEAEYFDINMADLVQNWQKKWFYIKDKKFSEKQKFGLALFDPKKGVKKLQSLYLPLSNEELKETEPLISRIVAPQAE
jgi:hypothetical protein